MRLANHLYTHSEGKIIEGLGEGGDNLHFGCSIVDVLDHLARGLRGISQTMQRP